MTSLIGVISLLFLALYGVFFSMFSSTLVGFFNVLTSVSAISFSLSIFCANLFSNSFFNSLKLSPFELCSSIFPVTFIVFIPFLLFALGTSSPFSSKILLHKYPTFASLHL